MRARSLPRSLREVVALTLAASACGGGGEGSAATPIADGMSDLCTGNTVPLTTGFRPASPVDYLAFRTESMSYRYDVGLSDAGSEDGDAGVDLTPDGGRAADGWTRTLSEPTGEPCAGATDRAGCQKRFEELRLLTSCDSTQSASSTAQCRLQHLVYTRGDEIGTVSTREEMIAFLGAIDTKEEALRIAQYEGLRAVCSASGPRSGWKAVTNGFELSLQTGGGCSSGGSDVDEVLVRVTSDGRSEIVSRRLLREEGPCTEGRRPAGLRPVARRKRSRSGGVGTYFARAAHLEAASVLAFESLSRELASLGAPPRILRAVERAREDEVRHAETATKIARRFGATPPPVRAKRPKARRALAVAIENAREGCVRETLGAAIALFRAERASDPEIAKAMKRIAEDELRHARLSWEISEWLDGTLSARGRAAVRRAAARELEALRGEVLRAAPDPEIVRVAGAPDAAELSRLFARIEREVWAPAQLSFERRPA